MASDGGERENDDWINVLYVWRRVPVTDFVERHLLRQPLDDLFVILIGVLIAINPNAGERQRDSRYRVRADIVE